MAFHHLYYHHNTSCYNVCLIPTLFFRRSKGAILYGPLLTNYSGVVFFPDTPEKTKTRWLTDAEKVLARSRVEQDGFRVSLGINKTLWKRVFMRWEFYFFASIGTIFWTSLYGYGTPFVLWLNSQPDKYSVATVNNLGTITSAVSAVSALVVAFYVDIRGKRWEPAIFAGFVALFCNLVLAIWHIPVGLKFFSYIAMGAAVGVGPLLVTWTADALADDLEVRAITIATYNAFGEMMGLVVPLVAWPVSHAPTFRGGFIWVCKMHLKNGTYIFCSDKNLVNLSERCIYHGRRGNHLSTT